MDEQKTVVNEQPAQPTQPTADEITKTLLTAIDAKQARNEKSIINSFAGQYGINEQELTAILENAKAEKAKQIPPEVQAQIEQANERANKVLIGAEVRAVCAELGVIDSEAAMMMMVKDGIKVEQDGSVKGVKEAIEALKETKGYLFKQEQKQGAWGVKQGATGTQQVSGVEAAFLKRNPNIKL